MKQFFPTLFLMLLCSVAYAQQQDSVTISGRVTDYKNGDRGEGLYSMEKEIYVK